MKITNIQRAASGINISNVAKGENIFATIANSLKKISLCLQKLILKRHQYKNSEQLFLFFHFRS